jgi:flagellin-specific chaperone FliS
MYFKKQLLEANIKKDGVILEQIIKMLKELRDAWDQISANEAKSDKNMNIGAKGNFSIEG